MFAAITEPGEIQEALAEFYARLRKGARTVVEDRIVGFPGGSEPHTIYWHNDPGLWIILEDNEDSNRSWNCFGTVDPRSTTKNLDIVCEINFPHEGINRRIAGVFVTDDDGELHIAHSGRIGGNKGPAARAKLTEYYEERGRCIDIAWPDGLETRWIRISSLRSNSLIHEIHAFVSIVDSCKNPVDTQEKDDDDSRAPLTFQPEFSGTRAPYTPPGLVEAGNDHGPIVNALEQALRKVLPHSRYAIGNDRQRDLVIAHGGMIVALFEVKPDTGPYSIYTGIGQLFYHTAGLDPMPAQILVVPEGLSQKSTRKLQQLGIELLTCRRTRSRPEFPHLHELVARLGLSRSRRATTA